MRWLMREVGLAVGEPPATRGYTPSVFAHLPKLLERAGTGKDGSITAFYTVLVDGDDMNEPIADAVRGILTDTSSWIARAGQRGHYPAIDVLQSVSRVMSDIITEEHQLAAETLKRHLAVYRQSEDLINIGAYQRGSNPEIDEALSHIENIWQYTRSSARMKKSCTTMSSMLCFACLSERVKGTDGLSFFTAESGRSENKPEIPGRMDVGPGAGQAAG